MRDSEQRVLMLIRAAFADVRLGNGVGLRQGQGLDDYADEQTLALYRQQDEKEDWSAIPCANLDQCNSSLSFFDPDGMRFHLPAYLVADLNGELRSADILFHLTHMTDYATSRFDNLSPAQRQAVREFLLLRLSTSESFLRPMIERSLHNYWTDTKS